jgi:Obg family GTPase CgtA
MYANIDDGFDYEDDDYDENDEEYDDEEDDDYNSNGSKLEMPIIPTFNLDEDGATVLVALGGDCGVGNGSMAGSSTERSKSLPATVIPGNQGVHRSLILELKLIADVGLVGFPNAGKSTLLRALSNAKPKVAPYPFTTLQPSVGVVEFSDLERLTVADIPGLIDGASENRGLGHDFLRHIERTKILLFVIDGVGSEGRDPCDDLKCLLNELEFYNPEMLEKPSLVFSNKVDLSGINISTGKDLLNELENNGNPMKNRLLNLSNDSNLELLTGSARKGIGMGELATKLRLMSQKETIRIELKKEEERLLALEEETKRLEAVHIKKKKRKYLGKGRGWVTIEK